MTDKYHVTVVDGWLCSVDSDSHWSAAWARKSWRCARARGGDPQVRCEYREGELHKMMLISRMEDEGRADAELD